MKYVMIVLTLLAANFICRLAYLHETSWLPVHEQCVAEIAWLETHKADTPEFDEHLKLGRDYNDEENRLVFADTQEAFTDPLWLKTWRK